MRAPAVSGGVRDRPSAIDVVMMKTRVGTPDLFVSEPGSEGNSHGCAHRHLGGVCDVSRRA